MILYRLIVSGKLSPTYFYDTIGFSLMDMFLFNGVPILAFLLTPIAVAVLGKHRDALTDLAGKVTDADKGM